MLQSKAQTPLAQAIGAAVTVAVVVLVFVVLGIITAGGAVDRSALRTEKRLTETLRQVAAARLAVLSSLAGEFLDSGDATQLQKVVELVGRKDPLVTTIALVDTSGLVLAHSDPKQVRQIASGQVAKVVAGTGEAPVVSAPNDETIVFHAPLRSAKKNATLFLAYSRAPAIAATTDEMSHRGDARASALLYGVLIGIPCIGIAALITLIRSRPKKRQRRRTTGHSPVARGSAVEVTSFDQPLPSLYMPAPTGPNLPAGENAKPGFREVPSKFHGDLGSIGVSALLTMFEMERKTGRLVLKGAEKGRMFLREGRVLAASVDGDAPRNGAEAVYAMFSWESGKFEFTYSDVDMEDSIQTSTTHLILEAARRVDEVNA